MGSEKFRLFPSVRFESFLVLLKNAKFIIGNSSAGIREAPYYGLPTVNIGTRQQNRALHSDIINCDYDSASISKAIEQTDLCKLGKVSLFGTGKSDKLFLEALQSEAFWNIDKQKRFRDLVPSVN